MKRTALHITLILILAIFAGNQKAYSQTKVQVVTQKQAKTFKWKPGQELEIIGERAEIYCTTHGLNTIVIEVELIAKHKDKSVAEKDLKKLQLMMDKVGGKIFIRDFIQLDSDNKKPESGLKTVMHIKVPANCPITVNNYFGKIDFENLQGILTINGEYSKINLMGINGKIKVSSKFGDIKASNTSGQLGITSNRSNITLENVSGMINLKSTLAEIRITGLKNPESLRIDAKKSKVYITSIHSLDFGYILELEKVDFTKPNWLYLKYTQKEAPFIKANTIDFEKLPLINIKLNTGSLALIKSSAND
jgi:hypothetical protein